jgi:RND superfamily putative drug exporter
MKGNAHMPAPPPAGTLLGRLGGFVHRRRRWVLIGTLVAVLGLAPLAATAMGALVLNRWEAPGTESVLAGDALREDYGTGNANLMLLVSARSGDVDDPAVGAAAGEVAGRLAAEPGVGDVWSYWSQERDPTLRSDDGSAGLVLAWVEGDATTARALIADLLVRYTLADPAANTAVDVRVAGSEAASTQISALATQDFVRAEIIIIPLMLILLVVIYRRVGPALLTLGVGLFSVLATLAVLRGLAELTEVASFAANITLVMGIGLGVDYSLFTISRFREEQGRGAGVAEATVRTLATAGRTVVFSALTVAASLSVLLLFPFPFLQSFAYAGIAVVATAVLGSLLFLPAALAALATRAERRGRTPAPPVLRALEGGTWYRLGRAVMRRPVLFGGAALALVLALAAPALGARIGLPDDRVLPPDASVHQTYDALRAGFSVEANDALHVLVPGVPAPDDVRAYAAELSGVEGIAQVNSAAGTFVDGSPTGRSGPPADRLVAGTGTRLEAVPTREALAGTDTDRLVDAVRAVPAPADGVLVGGYPAQLADFRAVLLERVPLVAALILAVTVVVLFLMSGSVLIPLKATVLNLLSLGVMFGVLVTIFQNGWLADLLGFTPIGTLDPAFPILMFCVAYGLSMDYEVFMLSRISEEYRRGGDNTHAVLAGLQRSGPLITAAALTLAVSFAVYATGQVMYLKMIGIGIAVAVLVDATLIRAVLVPAFMRLAGSANWWAPRPLRALHDRFGISESGDGPDTPAPGRTAGSVAGPVR